MTPSNAKIVLGIETSCDETAVAVIEGPGLVLGQALSSQVPIHRPFGGVVPEVASRRHLETIDPLLCQALEQAGCTLNDLNAIAVTAGPGLVGAILVGLSYAKGLAYGLNIPLIGIHHLEAHVAAVLLDKPDLEFPFLALVVSGGHTSLYRVDEGLRFTRLGRTIDDAAGEALDKGAKMMGLPYPGGPEIERLAQGGTPGVPFPRAWLGGSLDFSFSGLKTALRTHLTETASAPERFPDTAASYQQAVVEVLTVKTVWAAERHGLSRIAVVGGVAANRLLRDTLTLEAAARGFEAVFPPRHLCTDNAVMVAAAGYHMLRQGRYSGLSLDASAVLPHAGAPA